MRFIETLVAETIAPAFVGEPRPESLAARLLEAAWFALGERIGTDARELTGIDATLDLHHQQARLEREVAEMPREFLNRYEL